MPVADAGPSGRCGMCGWSLGLVAASTGKCSRCGHQLLRWQQVKPDAPPQDVQALADEVHRQLARLAETPIHPSDRAVVRKWVKKCEALLPPPAYGLTDSGGDVGLTPPEAQPAGRGGMPQRERPPPFSSPPGMHWERAPATGDWLLVGWPTDDGTGAVYTPIGKIGGALKQAAAAAVEPEDGLGRKKPPDTSSLRLQVNAATVLALVAIGLAIAAIGMGLAALGSAV